MFRVLKIFMSLTLSVPAAATTSCETLLVPEYREAVRAIETPESTLRVSVLHGTVAGRPRVIVLLGDQRGATPMAGAERDKLARHFDAYVVEHADYTKTWGGRSLKLSSRAMEFMWPIGASGG